MNTKNISQSSTSKSLFKRLIAGLICCVIVFSCTSSSTNLPFINSVSDLVSGNAQNIPGTDNYWVSGTTGDYIFLTGVGGVMELRDPTQNEEIFVVIPKEKYKSFAQGTTVRLQLKPLLRANGKANLINANLDIFIIN